MASITTALSYSNTSSNAHREESLFVAKPVVFYGAPEMIEDQEAAEFWTAIAPEVEANYTRFFGS